MKRFNEYLKIKDAAQLLGVTENTLRNWEKAEKIAVYRHPLNDYRLYNQEELQNLLKKVK